MTGESWGFLLIATMLYFPLHLALYVAILRNLPTFSKEKPIFLYHFASACLCSGIAFAFALYDQSDESIATAVIVIFAHGIYSLSFLELWSLSQISYSREILVLAERQGRLDESKPHAALVLVGDTKKTGRLESLLRLKIIENNGDEINLAPKGIILARILRLMAWFANLRQTG